MKKFCCMVLLVLCVVGLPVSAAAQGYDLPAEISVTAAEAYFINLDTGLVVYEKDADTPRSIASLTKLMTSLLLMENVQDLENTMITAERNLYVGSIIDPSSSNADIRPGESVSALNMLYAMMLPSANEAAEAVGYYLSGGNLQNFYAMMNQRAKELGCTNTNFASTNGLVDQEGGNWSTAHDVALIAQECWKHEIFRTVCGTQLYWMPMTDPSITVAMTSSPITSRTAMREERRQARRTSTITIRNRKQIKAVAHACRITIQRREPPMANSVIVPFGPTTTLEVPLFAAHRPMTWISPSLSGLVVKIVMSS